MLPPSVGRPYGQRYLKMVIAVDISSTSNIVYPVERWDWRGWGGGGSLLRGHLDQGLWPSRRIISRFDVTPSFLKQIPTLNTTTSYSHSRPYFSATFTVKCMPRGKTGNESRSLTALSPTWRRLPKYQVSKNGKKSGKS